MTVADAVTHTRGTPALLGQTVVVIGGSSGMGLGTARRARAEGADVVLTGRDPGRLERAAQEVGALSTSAFDAGDPDRLAAFFDDVPQPIDHIMVTAGRPYYARLRDLDLAKARRDVDEHLWLPIHVARAAVDTVRPGGSLLFVSGTGARRAGLGLAVVSAMAAALEALIRNLALELAPIRANVISPGFVDTPLSAGLLGEQLEARRADLRATLPIGRVIDAGDIAALALHLMTNTALTGSTYDIDGGQQLVP